MIYWYLARLEKPLKHYADRRGNILSGLLKLLGICVLAAALLFAAAFVYIRLHGKQLLESSLSGALGIPIRFQSVAIDFDKSSLGFNNLFIGGGLTADSASLKAGKLTVTIDKDKLSKEKKFAIKEISIEGLEAVITRLPSGEIKIPLVKTGPPAAVRPENAPVAARPRSSSPFYGLANGIERINIADSSVTFKDGFIRKEPFIIELDQVSARISAAAANTSTGGPIQVNLSFDARVPRQIYGNGFVKLDASIAVHPGRTDCEAALKTGNIDVMFFAPYLERSSPFILRSGSMRSQTRFRMHGGIIDAPTVIVFRSLELDVDSSKENAQFMAVSVEKLTPYLTSGNNETVFDFAVTGPAEKPKVELGARVKYAIGMAAVDELSKAVRQFQKLQS